MILDHLPHIIYICIINKMNVFGINTEELKKTNQ